jgi:hypothetical protein
MVGGTRGEKSEQITIPKRKPFNAPLARFVASADGGSTTGIVELVNRCVGGCGFFPLYGSNQ